jgi:hypothetical protein
MGQPRAIRKVFDVGGLGAGLVGADPLAGIAGELSVDRTITVIRP